MSAITAGFFWFGGFLCGTSENYPNGLYSAESRFVNRLRMDIFVDLQLSLLGRFCFYARTLMRWCPLE